MHLIAHNGSAILGGAEIATARLLFGLQARGHEILLLCRDQNMRDRFSEFGLPVEILRIGGTVMAPDAARFAFRLRRHRPDALLLTTFKKVLLTGFGARLARVPLVVQRVGLSTDTPRSALYRYALTRLVDRVVLVAEEMRPAFLAGAPRLDPSRVVTIPNGVRTPARGRAPGAIRWELGIPDSTTVIGAVGRLARQKRFDRLIQALPQLPSDVHCLIAGEGDDREALERLARELGVEDRLHLPGFRSDVGDILAALDLFVISSDREGMSNSMLEAMALGVPVLSTPVSGAREALAPGEEGIGPGLLVDEAALPKAILQLVQDYELRQRVGEAGRRRSRESFSFDAVVDRWESLLSAGAPPNRMVPAPLPATHPRSRR